jgi:hypothetical protein
MWCSDYGRPALCLYTGGLTYPAERLALNQRFASLSQLAESISSQHDQSSQYQQMAAVPEEEFEARL